MDKLNRILNRGNKVVTLLLFLFVIAIIFGSIFLLVLSKSDKTLVLEYLNNYINNIKSNNLNYIDALKSSLINNISLMLLIWLLGISIIGIPIVIFLYFTKGFTLSFSITSILYNYKFKGIPIVIAYVFPHQIINIILYTILVMYSISVSIKLIYAIIKKQTINFKFIFDKYLKILIISVFVLILTSLYEVFIMPKLIKIIINILKL